MFLQVRPSEARVPETLVLPDDRKRLTRFFILAQRGVLPPDLDLPWGTADFEPNPPTGWAGLRLIARQMTDEIPPGKADSRPIVMMVFEQIDASAETPVGGPTTTQLEDGREAIVDESIQFSTGAYVPAVVGSEDPGNTGYYLLKEEAVDDGGLRRIKRTWVTAGIIATDDQIKNGGALLIKSITSVKTVPSTPSGYTLIGAPVQSPNGLPTYTYTYAKGEGLVSESIDARPEGLRVQTYVSLGTKQTPAGVVIRDEREERDGYEQFTVACMQNPTGGDPTSGSFSFEQYRPWTYPGRAFPYEVLISDYHLLDVFQSPPVTLDLEHVVTISYSTSSTLSVSNFWQPDDWAVVMVKMIGLSENPISIVKALPGYRSTDETPLTYTEPGTPGDQGSVMGNQMYGSTTATVTVLGGPESPDGNTYTVEARAEPAFSDVDGTRYYRRTLVTVAVPTQTALPSL